MSDTDTGGTYQYESDGDRRRDDEKAARIRELCRAGIYEEAMRQAGKIHHYERSNDLIDEVAHRRDLDDELRADGSGERPDGVERINRRLRELVNRARERGVCDV